VGVAESGKGSRVPRGSPRDREKISGHRLLNGVSQLRRDRMEKAALSNALGSNNQMHSCSHSDRSTPGPAGILEFGRPRARAYVPAQELCQCPYRHELANISSSSFFSLDRPLDELPNFHQRGHLIFNERTVRSRRICIGRGSIAVKP